MILEQCKGVHCVDLGENFQTHIYLQNLVSIQPRTSPPKFGRDSSSVRAAQRALGGPLPRLPSTTTCTCASTRRPEKRCGLCCPRKHHHRKYIIYLPFSSVAFFHRATRGRAPSSKYKNSRWSGVVGQFSITLQSSHAGSNEK